MIGYISILSELFRKDPKQKLQEKALNFLQKIEDQETVPIGTVEDVLIQYQQYESAWEGYGKAVEEYIQQYGSDQFIENLKQLENDRKLHNSNNTIKREMGPY